LAGCGPTRDEADSPVSFVSVSVVDADGSTISLDRPASRIVSLVPSASLTLDAIGARETLVARTDFDTVGWARNLPSVGGGLQPSLEAIIAAQPDLVIRFGGAQDPKTPARLNDVGIPHIAVRPDRVADVLTMIATLGHLTGRDAEADSLVRALESSLGETRDRARSHPPVRVAYVLGGSPPWVAGPDTYIHELVEIAGGVNVFGDLTKLYGAVSPENFLAREIDVILTTDASALDPRLSRHARLVEVSDAFELPGPSVASAANEVARILREAGSS
jgi:iron complex transport system substrate-binding protein